MPNSTKLEILLDYYAYITNSNKFIPKQNFYTAKNNLFEWTRDKNVTKHRKWLIKSVELPQKTINATWDCH